MMKKKKQNRFIYRIHYRTANGSGGWKRIITRDRMTVARRDQLEKELMDKYDYLRKQKILVTKVEWVNKIG